MAQTADSVRFADGGLGSHGVPTSLFSVLSEEEEEEEEEEEWNKPFL